MSPPLFPASHPPFRLEPITERVRVHARSLQLSKKKRERGMKHQTTFLILPGEESA